MTSLTCLRSEEQASAERSIVADALLGTWLNTNPSTRGIVSAALTRTGTQTVVRIIAAGSASPHDWGETDASVFAAGTSSTEAVAFSAFYDFGFMESVLQAHVRQGVLIIAKFERFKDNSGRSNYFSKEFFYRAE